MLRTYHCTLQDQLRLSDNRWDYRINNLPDPNDCDRAGYIKSCCLYADTSRQSIVLKFTKIPSNRAISKKPLSAFIHVTCADFRIHTEDGKPTTFRESSEYIAKLLEHGLILNGVKYSFYGHSNSQLKSRSCFLMAGSQQEVDREVESLGDFSTMKSVAKKAKRIGLLFSTAHSVINVPPDRCKDISDIERDEYIFTDGCGSISRGLARLMAQKKPIVFRNKRYHPSVFQIRYRGYKGVVTIEPRLPSSTWLHLRKSMRKFSGGDDHGFAVVEYSKPYTYGYLNDETVLLLHALGVTQEIFERKQSEYISFLELAGRDSRTAFRFLVSAGHFEFAERCLLEGIEAVSKQLNKLVALEHSKMLNKRDEYKCRILIPKSRLVFGVCDPYGILKEGQCYVSPTSDEDGLPHALTGSYVLVTRNPCLHPGDVQKLWAVAIPELAHLNDCIVFPTNGRRPAADMMSGGDLDGDTFFVCWDSDLIPAETSQPAEYPRGKEPIQFSKITSQDRIDYFSRSSSMQLGQVKNLYLKWAHMMGPLSTQCQELNRLFSQCVDANKIEIPKRLSNAPQGQNPSEPFILDILHQAAEQRVRTCVKPELLDSIDSEERLLSILAEPGGMSQFELAKFTLRWCQSNHVRFEDYWHYIDTTKLSNEERTWFISLLPARPGIAELVTNDLMHSNILSHTELHNVGLRNAKITWRSVFESSTDRLANLLDTLRRTFPFFTRKILILRIHERLSIAVYLPRTIDIMDDFVLKDCGRLFAFPHDKGSVANSRTMVPTKHNACLYYDHNKFELFEGQRANTFVFLTRAANDDSRYGNVKGRGQQARAREATIHEGINYEWRTSIALAKFSQPLATHVGRLKREGISAAELYVISNTDTRSLRNLDLWLEQIDTEKVHRNFGNDDDEPREVFTLVDTQWKNETEAVTRIARDCHFDDLGIASPDVVARILELARLGDSQQLAGQVCSHWTEILRIEQEAAEPDQVTSRIIDFLFFMPGLVIYFIRLCPWTWLHPTYRESLLRRAPDFLNALVLSANRMDRLAASYMARLLSEVAALSVGEVESIVIKVALTITSTETALDILMEGLEPMTSRPLLDTPEESQYFVKQLSAIAIDHIEEGSDLVKSSKSGTYRWHFKHPLSQEQGRLLLKCDYRIDAPKTVHLAIGDHVRFICFDSPANIVLVDPCSFEALVEKADIGQITFKCLRYPPAWYQKCSWTLENLGSFVTAQTMIDAVTKLMTEKEACCEAFRSLFPSQTQVGVSPLPAQLSSRLAGLNNSQRAAVIGSLTGPVTCIWGPPGTGKTHTIVSIISEILLGDPEKRLLVTAPTHNAVDHVMRQYLRYTAQHESIQNVNALRVSTDIRKVSPDIRAHTCDAMLGKDINQFPSARKKAQQQITRSRLIFTTCIGAGLGLLRNEQFGNIIIDEASQQTEPASLVPLVRGASRVVLVGDHVQLRATVQPNAQALGFDVSLFERLWLEPSQNDAVRKVMLDTQYRMHPKLCAFPSQEFHEAKLRSAEKCNVITLPLSAFLWPDNDIRSVFVQVSTPEDLGRKSKSNSGQGQICQEIVHQLRSPLLVTSQPSLSPRAPPTYSIAILTPYTRQAELLRRLMPEEIISSIDGFQGQEADVVVYVTVRCNLKRDIGFLKDMRRLNVALTRAKAGIIVIGDEDTLCGKGRVFAEDGLDRGMGEREQEKEECFEVWKRLVAGMGRVKIDIDLKGDDSKKQQVK